MKNPYKVPPFDAGLHKPKVVFYWWSWHPNYPYWSRSCWGGNTEDEAWKAFASPFASSLRYYHNKLIREGDGHFTEVYDMPCERLDIWQKIARNKSWRRPTDAKPIKGWDK